MGMDFGVKLGLDQDDYPTDLVKRWTVPLRLRWWTVALIPIVLVVVWYFLTHGSESRRVQFHGLSGDKSGSSFGGSLIGFKGQTIKIDYEVKVMPRGHFQVVVFRDGVIGIEEELVRKTVRQTGTGQIELKVPKTGLYQVRCNGTPDKRGYDVTYEASWRVG